MLNLLSMIMQVSNSVFLHLRVITQEFYENLNLLSYLDMFLVFFSFILQMLTGLVLLNLS